MDNLDSALHVSVTPAFLGSLALCVRFTTDLTDIPQMAAGFRLILRWFGFADKPEPRLRLRVAALRALARNANLLQNWAETGGHLGDVGFILIATGRHQ